MRTNVHFSCGLAVPARHQQFKVRGSKFKVQSSPARTALTLLEMMVSMTLLAVIMIGLLAMFSHTQKALHSAVTQSDVFENARGAMQLVSRDLSEMSDFGDTNVISATGLVVDNPAGPLPLPGSGGGTTYSQPIFFSEAYWLNRVNDDWQGTGYYVGETNYGVGTLYRFSETEHRSRAPQVITNFFAFPALSTNRVSGGIVHFQLTAVYPVTNLFSTNFIGSTNFTFTESLPAFVDIDLGVLEPGTLKQFESLTGDVAVAQNFLRDHVGKIHFFRERVPIRNFVNPYRANEVP
jgi:type II secretory pathway pseudopilin PulG